MPETIKVLRLGSSLDFLGELPPGTRAWEVAQGILAAQTGLAVQTFVKPSWPTPELGEILTRWINELQPDILVICVSSFWVETETLSNRFQALGKPGRKIADASRKMSLRPVVAERRVYQWGRLALLRSLGGRAGYSPARIEELMEGWLRAACRSESLGIAVVGTPFSPDTLADARARRRAGARKDELRARLARVCSRLGVHHDLPAHGPDAFSAELRLADRVHFNELAHARMGEIDGRAMVEVWRRMNGGTPAESG